MAATTATPPPTTPQHSSSRAVWQMLSRRWEKILKALSQHTIDRYLKLDERADDELLAPGRSTDVEAVTRHPVVYEAITPLARIASRGAAGVDPHTFGIGPVQAAHTALHRAGITWANLAAVELNEAFAAQSVRPALRALLGDPRQERSQ